MLYIELNGAVLVGTWKIGVLRETHNGGQAHEKQGLYQELG